MSQKKKDQKDQTKTQQRKHKRTPTQKHGDPGDLDQMLGDSPDLHVPPLGYLPEPPIVIIEAGPRPHAEPPLGDGIQPPVRPLEGHRLRRHDDVVAPLAGRVQRLPQHGRRLLHGGVQRVGAQHLRPLGRGGGVGGVVPPYSKI